MLDLVKWIAKAIVGGLAAFAGTLAGAAPDIDPAEWWTAIAAAASAAAAVWGIPNRHGYRHDPESEV